MSKHWKTFWTAILLSLVMTGIIGIFGYRFDSIELLPDTGFSWYYWKLPERTFWPMLTAWSFYVLHQVAVWLLIWQMQFGDKSKRDLRRKILCGVNIGFILLHFLQSHIWYDGLAQDVPVLSSQGSVIVMLVLVLIMDNSRRGLFFGKKLGGFKKSQLLVKRYHGYFIAWALIYTFWYHPMVATSGHLVGFFYMFLLFIQMSMLYTPVHMNRFWRFTVEVFVLFHGTMVAINQGNGMWPMFLFGFATMAVVVQIYGLGLQKWMIRLIQAIYVIGVILVYGGFTGHSSIDMVHQITWIPIIDYALVFAIMILLEGGNKVFGKKVA